MTYLLKTPAYLIFEEVQNSDIMTISQRIWNSFELFHNRA